MTDTSLALTTNTVPFSKLVLSPRNVRQNPGDVSALAASIRSLGLLQNLVVSTNDAGLHEVHAGGRRFAALGLLVAEGKLSAEFSVPVTVIDAHEATAASLSENYQRVDMHAADELIAFQTMAAEGHSLDRIADVFKVTVNWVERRLKMTEAAPELFELFRADEITANQLIGLCATDDHAVQIAVWNSTPSWARDERSLRAAVLANEVEASKDHRVEFLGGIDSYIAAGGECRADLFSQEGEGTILTNPALLNVLVKQQLEAMRADYLAEGWAWVDVIDPVDHVDIRRYGYVAKQQTDDGKRLVAEWQSLYLAADAQYDAIHEAAEDEGRELSDEEEQQCEELREQLSQYVEEMASVRRATQFYPVDVMAVSGVVLYLARTGLVVERGRIRAVDRSQARNALGDGVEIHGGRETKVPGKKRDAVSDALRRSLLGHRNLAVQEVGALNVHAMKVLQACWAVQSMRHDAGISTGYDGAPTNLSIGGHGGTRVGHSITDDTGKAKSQEFDDACAALVRHLPDETEVLWDALMALPIADLDSIIACNVARSISLDSEHRGLTAKLLAALGFDMSAHFTPTVDNYLGQVPKAHIIEALAEADQVAGAADMTALAAMKKGVLAEEAQKRLEGTGWVPAGIRVPAQVDAETEAKEGPQPVAAASDDGVTETAMAA